MKHIFLLMLSLTLCLYSQSIKFDGEPELFLPGIISVEGSQVKITFSKDGNLVLWGEINRTPGVGGFDIWQAEKSDTGWTNPHPVSFNSTDNDFDPCFSADGGTVYFFSNRPGGFGGDDIYNVGFDPETKKFGDAVNIGSEINTSGDEWGPVESSDGMKFLFCTDGAGGKGEHDVFVCNKVENAWSNPELINEINSPEDDFDPIFLSDGKSILFTRKMNEDEAYLYISRYSDAGYSVPERLDSTINNKNTWNFGSSVNHNEKSAFYYSSYCEDNTMGRLDIYKVNYNLIK